jgi:hypothetical protein
VIAPLLWLLLSSLGLMQPTTQGVKSWDGKPPIVITRPSEPTAGDIVTVVVAKLPKAASAVAVVAATDRYPARPAGRLWQTSFQPKTEGGPLNLSVRFTVGKRHYSAPGGVVFVKPKSTVP